MLDFYVHVFFLMYFESKFDAVDIGETHFQIRALMTELETFFLIWAHLGKHCLNVEFFEAETILWGFCL